MVEEQMNGGGLRPEGRVFLPWGGQHLQGPSPSCPPSE